MTDEGVEKSRLYKTSSKRLSTPLIVTVVLLLAVLMGGGYVFFQSQHPVKDIASPLPSSAPTAEPTAIPTPTEVASPSAKVSPTSAKVSPSAKPTAVLGSSDKTATTVSVLNGSGTPGLASKVGNYMTGLGYTVSSTGNADAFDYEGITISVKKSKSALLPQLRKDLSSQGVIGSTSATFTGTTDVQIIVGK